MYAPLPPQLIVVDSLLARTHPIKVLCGHVLQSTAAAMGTDSGGSSGSPISAPMAARIIVAMLVRARWRALVIGRRRAGGHPVPPLPSSVLPPPFGEEGEGEGGEGGCQIVDGLLALMVEHYNAVTTRAAAALPPSSSSQSSSSSPSYPHQRPQEEHLLRPFLLHALADVAVTSVALALVRDRRMTRALLLQAAGGASSTGGPSSPPSSASAGGIGVGIGGPFAAVLGCHVAGGVALPPTVAVPLQHSASDDGDGGDASGLSRNRRGAMLVTMPTSEAVEELLALVAAMASSGAVSSAMNAAATPHTPVASTTTAATRESVHTVEANGVTSRVAQQWGGRREISVVRDDNVYHLPSVDAPSGRGGRRGGGGGGRGGRAGGPAAAPTPAAANANTRGGGGGGGRGLRNGGVAPSSFAGRHRNNPTAAEEEAASSLSSVYRLPLSVASIARIIFALVEKGCPIVPSTAASLSPLPLPPSVSFCGSSSANVPPKAAGSPLPTSMALADRGHGEEGIRASSGSEGEEDNDGDAHMHTVGDREEGADERAPSFPSPTQPTMSKAQQRMANMKAEKEAAKQGNSKNKKAKPTGGAVVMVGKPDAANTCTNTDAIAAVGGAAGNANTKKRRKGGGQAAGDEEEEEEGATSGTQRRKDVELLRRGGEEGGACVVSSNEGPAPSSTTAGSHRSRRGEGAPFPPLGPMSLLHVLAMEGEDDLLRALLLTAAPSGTLAPSPSPSPSQVSLVLRRRCLADALRSRGPQGQTPLMCALAAGHYSTVGVLLEGAGAEAEEGEEELVNNSSAAASSLPPPTSAPPPSSSSSTTFTTTHFIDAPYIDGKTVLHFAILNRDVAAVRRLIAHGADVDGGVGVGGVGGGGASSSSHRRPSSSLCPPPLLMAMRLDFFDQIVESCKRAIVDRQSGGNGHAQQQQQGRQGMRRRGGTRRQHTRDDRHYRDDGTSSADGVLLPLVGTSPLIIPTAAASAPNAAAGGALHSTSCCHLVFPRDFPLSTADSSAAMLLNYGEGVAAAPLPTAEGRRRGPAAPNTTAMAATTSRFYHAAGPIRSDRSPIVVPPIPILPLPSHTAAHTAANPLVRPALQIVKLLLDAGAALEEGTGVGGDPLVVPRPSCWAWAEEAAGGGGAICNDSASARSSSSSSSSSSTTSTNSSANSLDAIVARRMNRGGGRGGEEDEDVGANFARRPTTVVKCACLSSSLASKPAGGETSIISSLTRNTAAFVSVVGLRSQAARLMGLDGLFATAIDMMAVPPPHSAAASSPLLGCASPCCELRGLLLDVAPQRFFEGWRSK